MTLGKLYRSKVAIDRGVSAPRYIQRTMDLSTQVAIGIEAGLKHESSIHCDGLVSLAKVGVDELRWYASHSRRPKSLIKLFASRWTYQKLYSAA